MINYVIGDATRPQGDGSKIIVHVCNDIGAWGAGFVMAISARWSEPEENFRYLSSKGENGIPDYLRGYVQYIQVEKDIWVANMFAQRGVRSPDNLHPLNYGDLRSCLVNVANSALFENMSVHMPRIGCGLAGGSWDKVEALINETMPDVSVTVYDLE